MRFDIDKENLKKAILLLRNSLDAKALNPLLLHFLFNVDGNSLSVTATNSKFSTIWQSEISSEEKGSFTLPGNVLGNLVSSLDSEKVTLDYDEKKRDVKLICGNYVWESVSGDPDDFPVVSIPENLKELALPEKFISLLKSVFFSISGDSDKADLNSLCIDIDKNEKKMNLISTDRYRLSLASCPIEYGQSYKFLIRKSSVAEIIRLEPTKMLYLPDDLKSKLFFKKEDDSGSFIFQTVLTDVTFPNVYPYLQSDFDEAKLVSLSKKSDLVRILKRMRLTSDKMDKTGRLSLDDKSLAVSTENSANRSKDILQVESEITTTFDMNIDYALDYLTQELDEQIDFKIIENKCLIFNKDNYRHILSINS